jgi:hypothetical protein
MEFFYIAVLTIAAVILIMILTTVGVAIRKSNQNVEWPPTGGRCPDGWEEDKDTPGKCYIPSDMVNSAKVTPESMSGVASDAKGYAFADDAYASWLNGDIWRECGKATVSATTADPITTTLSADSKSDFNYFKPGDKIRIGTVLTQYTIATVGNDSKSLTITGTIASSGAVTYYGKRISVNFNKATVYKGADEGATKCLRKKWANDNEVQWDGVSNYNKCP